MPAYRVAKQKAPRKGRKGRKPTAPSAPALPRSALGDHPDQEHPGQIIDENGNEYLMRWLEPDDNDKTKLKYEPSWVKKSWANMYAVIDWNQREREQTTPQASAGVAAEKERDDEVAGDRSHVQQTAVAAGSAQEEQGNEAPEQIVDNTENIVVEGAAQAAQVLQEQTASAES